ncbi:Hypothetical predicted protein [Paramuricea clavata]|uniref:Uncharacterized protein n=1 Tax=Paramuricea clavata TaxID=317549 RepID=A0A6S7G1B2_PARCT|nr:Hypothetical predicted protein [Paramuricea clavata]
MALKRLRDHLALYSYPTVRSSKTCRDLRLKRLTLIGLKDYRAIVKNLTQIEASDAIGFAENVLTSALNLTHW